MNVSNIRVVSKAIKINCWLLVAAASLSSALSFSDDGSAEYQRCAACHLSSGVGVPGAFPPLINRVAKIAQSAEGRAYLVKVVNKGLMGTINVEGQMYMGVMPGQGSVLNPESATKLLNYLVQQLDKDNLVEGWKPYTVTEVEALFAEGGTVMTNAGLRSALLKKYPELK